MSSKELVPVKMTITTRNTLNADTMRYLSDKDLAKLYQIFVTWKTDPKKITDLVKAEVKRRELSDGWIRIMTRYWPL
jgi:hypothetical protein